MLSYQHAYHAGNPADLHKHIVLSELLAQLTLKTRPISYMETHAGRGLYDLSSPESQKTGEAAEGIAQLEIDQSPYQETVQQIRERYGKTAYPGSPLIAKTLLRDTDKMHLMELHPQEFTALKKNIRSDNVAIHKRDGFEGVLAIAPPKPRKGLVLIDPPYEVKSEYVDTAKFAMKLIAKWPEATIMIWYPILPAKRHLALLDGLKINMMKDEVQFDLKDNLGMTGSGIILINPLFGSAEIFNRTRELGAPVIR